MLSTPKIVFFPSGIEGVVEKEIALYQTGLVKLQGRLWRAKLYELNCQTTLRIQQPVLAIAREGNVAMVIPHHCLLWERYINDFWRYLSPRDITTMRRFERNWRFSA